MSSSSASGTKKKRGRPCHVDGQENGHPVHTIFKTVEATGLSRCTVEGCNEPDKKKHAGNLMKHLKSHHPDIYLNVKAEVDRNAKSLCSEPKAKRQCLNGVKMTGPALKLHTVRLVSENGLPFRMLGYPAFQDIVNPMIDALPAGERFKITPQNASEQVGEFAEMVRNRIIKEVDGKMISLKVDGASRDRRHFVGITIQYCHEDKLTVRTLAVEEMLVASTAANLKRQITIVLNRFKIETKQLVSFTSDSGANYNSAGKMLTEPDVMEDDNPDDLFEEEAWQDATIELLQDDFNLQSIRCAAHTLQLAIDDALKTSELAKTVTKKIRDLAKYLLQDTKARQLKEAQLPLPKLDVCTRWGSTYDLLVSVVHLRNFVQFTLKWTKASDEVQFSLSEEEWQQVDSVVEVLRPLRKATTLLQKEDLTLGDFFAIWSGVCHKLERKKDSSPLAAALHEAMLKRARRVDYSDRARGERYSPLFHYPAFNAAVFLDPRYLSLLSAEEKADAKKYLVELYDRIQAIRGPTSVGDEAASSGEEEEHSEGSDSDDPMALFRSVVCKKNQERRRYLQSTSGVGQAGSSGSRGDLLSKRALLSAMLDQYDRSTDSLPPSTTSAEVFQYWAKKKLICPELCELAGIVLAIPATQVSVERLFSALRFILKPQRYNLSSSHVDDITFLHTNKCLARSVVNNLLTNPPLPPPPPQSSSHSSEIIDDPPESL